MTTVTPGGLWRRRHFGGVLGQLAQRRLARRRRGSRPTPCHGRAVELIELQRRTRRLARGRVKGLAKILNSQCPVTKNVTVTVESTFGNALPRPTAHRRRFRPWLTAPAPMPGSAGLPPLMRGRWTVERAVPLPKRLKFRCQTDGDCGAERHSPHASRRCSLPS